MDYTGTGNTLQARDPRVLQLIMDSLRYSVQEMHIDGFRFDLAAALARGAARSGPPVLILRCHPPDPVVRGVKLIAEPWDVGEGGYQVGNFPVHWSEWNGRYRDTVRDLWTRTTTLAIRLRLPFHRQFGPVCEATADCRMRASTW